jgi:hypothetical protein
MTQNMLSQAYLRDTYMSFFRRVANVHFNQNVLPCELLLPYALRLLFLHFSHFSLHQTSSLHHKGKQQTDRFVAQTVRDLTYVIARARLTNNMTTRARISLQLARQFQEATLLAQT